MCGSCGCNIGGDWVKVLLMWRGRVDSQILLFGSSPPSFRHNQVYIFKVSSFLGYWSSILGGRLLYSTFEICFSSFVIIWLYLVDNNQIGLRLPTVVVLPQIFVSFSYSLPFYGCGWSVRINHIWKFCDLGYLVDWSIILLYALYIFVVIPLTIIWQNKYHN